MVYQAVNTVGLSLRLLEECMLTSQGDRPKFGEPSVATLTIGGDDIDFPVSKLPNTPLRFWIALRHLTHSAT